MMILRTLVSLACLAVVATGAAAADAGVTPAGFSIAQWQPQAGDVIRFDVLRDGKPFGSHSVAFGAGADGRLTARTEVSLKAGLGPVTLFRYKLDATETWLAGKLVDVRGEVVQDGDKRAVTAKRDGAALRVKGSDFSGVAPKDIIPASHWNFAQTQADKLLSTEDGEILDVKIARTGRETIRAAGQSIEATRYRLDSAIDVDLWYDDQGRWVKLAFETRGQDIEYVLAEMY